MNSSNFNLLGSDANKFVKENLYGFLDGKYNSGFNEEQLEIAKQVGFILNHLTINDMSFPNVKYVVSYGGSSIMVNFKVDIGHNIDVDAYIISTIKNTEDFNHLYLSFIRDYKIGKIISNE